jgi:hypothetical protein
VRRSLTAAACALALAAPATVRAQFGPPPSGFTVEDPVLRRIWSLGMDSSQVPRLAQVLMDSIGPRLTGTPQQRAANDWALRTYQSWGIEARTEQYGTWRGWRRGRTHIDLVLPRVRSLEGMMLAWSPGTGGRPVRGPVVVLPDLPDTAAFRTWLREARGKFVAVTYPEPTCRPDTAWASYGVREWVQRLRAERDTARRDWNRRVLRTGRTANQLHAALDSAGAAGILTTNWSAGYGVYRVFGTTSQRAPALVLSCEDYGLVSRLALNDQGPVVEVTAESESLGEVPVFNVIAELRGRELPQEYVMLSAHFDSWDGASGATDNGTGTVTMMEAMRLLKAAYPSPRRTILVGHWSGEEQGLIGSRAFAADHPEVVSGLQALFNQDNGTGRVQNMSGAGLVDATGNLARWLSRVPADITRHVTFGFPGGPAGGGSDNASFICAGAPGFGLGSGGWDYGSYTWHTNRDTYDKLSFDDVKNNAVLTAMLAYLASEDPERVPRERRTVFQRGPGGQPGSWPNCQPPQRSSTPTR